MEALPVALTARNLDRLASPVPRSSRQQRLSLHGGANIGWVNEAAVRAAERAAGRQHDVIVRQTAFACGLDPWEVTRLVLRGRWRQLYRGVLWTQPAAETPLVTALAAARWAAGDGTRPNGVVSGRSAARLWGFDEDRTPVVPQLILPRSGRRAQVTGIRYRWCALAAHEVTVHRRLPLTSVPRTLADLAVSSAFPQMLTLSDAALRTRLIDRSQLRALAAMLPRRARPALLHADGRAESPFESRVRAEQLLADVPVPSLQHEVRDHFGRFVARVDFAWPERMLAVRSDGAEVHVGPYALRRDLRRQNLLVRAGWTVLRFTWADLGAIAATVAAELTTSRPGVA